MGLVSLGIGYLYHRFDLSASPAVWQTVTFTTLTLAQMGNALATRSDRDTLWKIGLFSNRTMLGAVLLTFVLQLAVTQIAASNWHSKPLSISKFELGSGLVGIQFIATDKKGNLGMAE